MDEPLAALDMRSKADILPYLEKLHEMLSIPVLYVTHALEEVMRLADTLIIVEQGQIVNYGSLSDMLTRLDLPFAHVREAGVVIQAYVVEYDEQFQLIYLDFCGERLSLPATERMPLGQQVRISINARDVSLALENEVQSSILNIFKGEIVAIAEEKSGQLLVKLEVKGHALLARITKKSAFLLNLQCGMNVYVRVKSIGLI
jgi:molybdate transport system ATP-binding protein